MILIYLPKLSQRALYTFKQVFNEFLGCPTTFTTQPEEYQSYTGPKFCYSPQAIPHAGLYFCSVGLLFENRMASFEVSYKDNPEFPKLFPVSDAQSCLDFDPFAAIFYLLSRYEEYFPSIKDHLGRFEPKSTLAFQHGFLRKPVVDLWVRKIEHLLLTNFPTLKIHHPQAQLLPTFDVDVAWAYRNKGLVRTLGGIASALFSGKSAQAKDRLKVVFGNKADPFDTYDYILQSCLKANVPLIFFFLMADYGPLDHNIPVNNLGFQALIKHLGDYAEIGIHPSVASTNQPEKTSIEIKRLSDILHKDIYHSRQHYLMLRIPETYKLLLKNDIQHDYGMGFASEVGFRAGTGSSFYFFDLETDKPTNLLVHPFVYMDGTLHDYKKYSIKEALETVKELRQSCTDAGCDFSFLWHNSSLQQLDSWVGWNEVFEFSIGL